MDNNMNTDTKNIASGLKETSSPAESVGVEKSRWERSWPTIACGAGLFSDGYVQSVSRRLVPHLTAMLINSGHWFCQYNTWPDLRQQIQACTSTQERQCYCLRWHGLRSTDLWRPFRLLVSQKFPPNLHYHFDHLFCSFGRCIWCWRYPQ